MEVTKRIALKQGTMIKISEVLKNNLFTLLENSWLYTDDMGQPSMKITYKIEEDDVVMSAWMVTADMKILLDKIEDEIING